MKKQDSGAMSAREVRSHLKALTLDLKSAALFGKIPDGKPNDLLKYYYASKGHKILKSFQEWKEAGYSVIKGAKALHLWSRPKQFKSRPIVLDEETGETEQETYEAYSYICLFSDKQVEPATEREKRHKEIRKATGKPWTRTAPAQTSAAPAAPAAEPEPAPAPADASGDLLPF